MGDMTHVSEDEGRSENGNEEIEGEKTDDKPTNATVQVVIRLRPPDPVDEPAQPPAKGEYDLSETFDFPKSNQNQGSMISIKDPLSRGRSEHTFQFSSIFQPKHKQDAIFTTIAKPLVDRLLSGYNSCIFAYGQTGSGKTHSIFGDGNGEDRGLLPRSIEYLFENIEQISEGKEVGMVVSFLEVYLDQIQDLGRRYADRVRRMQSDAFPPGGSSGVIRTGPVRTGPGRIRPYSAQTTRGAPPPVLEKRPWSATDKRPTSAQSQRSCDNGAINGPDANLTGGDLEIREAPSGQVYVQNLSLIPVRNIAEVMAVVNSGLALRATYETKMNPTSSRSHTVFTINLVQKDLKKGRDAETMTSHFNLVDLAGSERLAKSKSEGKRFHEAVVINASLSALGRVILALASNPKENKYIPYRDSKLTRILQSGLGGNSYTTMLCCINPSSEHYEENLNSLSFADRCKNVDNRPMINFLEPNEGTGKAKIRVLKREVEDLKHQLAALRAGFIDPRLQSSLDLNDRSVDAIVVEEAKEKIKQIEEETFALKEKQRKAAEEIETYQKGKQELNDRESARVVEVRGLREEVQKGADEIEKTKVESEFKLRGQGDRLWNIIRKAQDHAKNLHRTKDQIFVDLPNVLKDTKNVIQEHRQTYQEKMEAAKKKHISATEAINKSHDEQLSNVEKKYKYWLREKEKELENFEKEMTIFSQAMRKEIKEYRTEIVGLYDLTRQLTRIIQDMESGIYPVSYKCNIKTVMLPVGAARPRALKDLSEDDFPQLFSSLRDTKAKAEKYERLMNKYSSNELGGTTQDTRGVSSNNQLPTPASPDTDPLYAFERTKSTMAGSTMDFDATRYSMELCRSAEGDNDALLNNLNEDKLRALVCSLKERCRGEFDIQAEKQKIRDEVMHELSGHSTIEYLRHLENEVERYKTEAQKEVEHSHNLRVALTSAMSGKA